MIRPFVFCIRCVPHFVLVVALFLTFLSTRVAVAQAVKAFPTAEGYGANTVGGRGGKVLYVTNLNDSGAGSLRDALWQTFPRTILFKVSGTIELHSQIELGPSQSYVTIAGQSAPGGGIQIKNHPISLWSGTHDVIIRHIRFRPGTESLTPPNPYWNGIDGFGANGASSGGPGQRVYNVILDHCSFEWATDENIDLSYNTTDVTVQWSIMAEGYIGDTKDSAHSMGMLIARYGQPPGEQQRMSIHHSLFAHNLGRNPRIGVNAPSKAQEQLIDFRNNIVYNWGGAQGPMELSHVLSDEVTPVPLNFGTILQINIVNNTYILGPEGGSGNWPGTIGHLQGPSKIYLAGNATSNYCPNTCDATHWNVAFINGNDLQFNTYASASNYKSTTEFPTPPVTISSASNVLSLVLPNVGATKPARDSVDSRITSEVQNGTGHIGPFNGQVNVTLSDYPTLSSTTPPTDTDGDGIPNSWESSHGLNPNNAADGAATAVNGYTNLENYLNELAGDPITGVGQLPRPTQLRTIAVTP